MHFEISMIPADVIVEFSVVFKDAPSVADDERFRPLLIIRPVALQHGQPAYAIDSVEHAGSFGHRSDGFVLAGRQTS